MIPRAIPGYNSLDRYSVPRVTGADKDSGAQWFDKTGRTLSQCHRNFFWFHRTPVGYFCGATSPHGQAPIKPDMAAYI
jgi:hypothetical protein